MQQWIGKWTRAAGQLLLISLCFICYFDLAGLASRGHLAAPLSGYLMAIFCGVAMQFVGAAIPNMRFHSVASE